MIFNFTYGTFTLFGHLFHGVLLPKYSHDGAPTTPTEVWFRLFPVRSSLTKGISYDFFSSAYLDISVQLVPAPTKSEDHLTKRWISPFGHRRITASSQLPVDFRGVARPSSAHFA